MPNVQVRNVSEEVYGVLVRRAQKEGQSLQQYLSDQLSQIACRPTLEEVFSQIDEQSLGRISSQDVVSALEVERACS